MKTIILAGGLGTRLQERTQDIPKPMVEVGGRPMLWHIMKLFAWQGFSEFVVALGYRKEVISHYFLNYHAHAQCISLTPGRGYLIQPQQEESRWNLHLLDTGLRTQTGGRIRKAMRFGGRERVFVTYGDGVADLDLTKLLAFHQSHGKLATVTAVRPPARFGHLSLIGQQVSVFGEKPQMSEGWINGGFFVLEPEVVDYLDGDDCIFERQPLETLAAAGQLMAYRHEGFWSCMDTLRDVHYLDDLWQSGAAPWALWHSSSTQPLAEN